MADTVTLGVRVPPELYERLRVAAYERRTKIVRIVIAAIEKELAAEASE